jgi:hypothetical protein
VGVGVTKGVAVVVGAGVGGGVGTGPSVGMDGARGFDSSRKGTKVTIPKFVAFLKPQIVWLITDASAVPHQL